MKSAWDIAIRVWEAADRNDVFGLSAQLSYYFICALFPFLLFLTTMLGFLAHTGNEVYENLMSYARQVLPFTAYDLVVNTLAQVHADAGGAKLSFGILASVWAASSGMSATMQGLNRSYEIKETRPWWKVKLVSIGLTLSLSGFLVVATVLVLYGTRIAEFIADYFGLQAYFTATWKLLQWPVALLFLLIGISLLYRFAPAAKGLRWTLVCPGALLAMGLWLAVSLGFRVYLQYFNSYNATYGSLGAVIVLLLWFYLSGAAILFGAEFNNELRKESATPIPQAASATQAS